MVLSNNRGSSFCCGCFALWKARETAGCHPERIRHIAEVNIPNAITFSRLVLTGIFVAGASLDTVLGHWIALVSFVIAAISDFLDGYLARRWNQITPMGKLMDPLADKVLVCSAFVYFSAENLCPVWVTVLIIAREFLVTGLRQIAVEAGHVMAADNLGKWKTGLQLTFCITCLVWFAFQPMISENPFIQFIQSLSSPSGWLQPISMWLALGLTLWSGWNYLWQSRDLLRGK